MTLNRLTVLVTDLDAASAFFQQAFGWQLIEDQHVSASKRILRVAPPRAETSLNLALPKPGDESLVGRQAGQRVLGFIDTDDLDADLARFAAHGVQIVDGPRVEPFGRCVLVLDLEGNTWEYVQRVAS